MTLIEFISLLDWQLSLHEWVFSLAVLGFMFLFGAFK